MFVGFKYENKNERKKNTFCYSFRTFERIEYGIIYFIVYVMVNYSYELDAWFDIYAIDVGVRF